MHLHPPDTAYFHDNNSNESNQMYLPFQRGFEGVDVLIRERRGNDLQHKSPAGIKTGALLLCGII